MNLYMYMYIYCLSQSDLERMNQELDALNSRKMALEDELAMSQVKKEAVVLYDQLREVEDKRDQVGKMVQWSRLIYS